LAKLAEIVLAAPGTQVSLDELFGQLKFLLYNQQEMDSIIVDNVQIVRCNFQFLEDDFFKSLLQGKK